MKFIMSPLQPPAAVNTTDPPDFWIVRFNASDVEMTTTDTRVVFRDLFKGTVYQAKVAGSNVRGIGSFSPYVYNQTNIDRKSVI